jgi:hypothetical protein
MPPNRTFLYAAERNSIQKSSLMTVTEQTKD